VIVVCTCGATLEQGQRCFTCEPVPPPRTELEIVVADATELAIKSGMPIRRALKKTAVMRHQARAAERKGHA
jgi:hypothetical protein